MSFDPEHNSLALDPNAAKNYATPYVEVWGPNGEHVEVCRWDNARDLLRFGTINKTTGEKQKWTRYNPASKPAPRAVEDEVNKQAVNDALGKKAEDNGKLTGLRGAAKLLGLTIDPSWGIKRIEAEIKNFGAAGRKAETPALKAPSEGLPDAGEMPPAAGEPPTGGEGGLQMLAPTEGLD